MKKSVCWAMTLFTLSALATARTNTVKTLTSDWTNAANFEDSSWLPGDGNDDTVIIPASATVTLSDADAPSIAQFSKLKRVIFAGEDSELDIVVDGDEPVDIPVPISPYQYRTGSRDVKGGPLVKKGSGTLHLSSAALTAPGDATTCFSYYSEIHVEAGVLKLLQNTAKKQYYFGRITVEKDATVYLPSSSVSGHRISVQGLNGAGDVTCDSAVPGALLVAGNRTVNPSDFSGRLSGTYSGLTVSSTGQTFSGTDSPAVVTASAYISPTSSSEEGEMGFAALNGKNANSSIGYNVTTLWLTGSNGQKVRANYVGPGGDIKTGFCLNLDGRGILAANGTGAVNVAQPIQRYYKQLGGTHLVFAGDAAVTNVFSSGISDNLESSYEPARGHGMYLSKEGTTTWRFNSYERTNAGGISVDEGVLQYETMAPAGKPCSLGTATFLSDGTTGVTDSNAAHRVDYAIRLGGTKSDGTTADSGRLEYVGTADFFVTNRQIAVAGTGGLRNNGAAKTCFRGVRGISENGATLVLDGDGTNTNEVNKVTDGTAGGKLSVVKAGSGTWMLTGEQSWSGDLDVRGGRLIVSNPQNYRWYKWCVTGLLPLENPDPSNSVLNMAILAEFALCAADKTEVTRGYPMTQRKDMGVAPGSAALVYDGPFTVYTTAPLSRLFDGMAYHNGSFDINFYQTVDKVTSYYRVTQENPDTWLTFVMRLPAEAPAIVGYDYANKRGTKYNDKYTCVSNYFVEASLDGCTWTRLKTFEGDAAPATNNGCDWKFNVGKDVETTSSSGTVLTHPDKWDAIPSAPDAYPDVLGNVGAVSVSGGATLELEPGSRPVSFSNLKVDATATSGSIVGFSLAEEGTLTVENVAKGQAEIELPIDLSQATDAANASAWTLFVNGKNATDRGWTVRSSRGKLTITRPGMMILLR